MAEKAILLIDCDNVFKTEYPEQGLGTFDVEINRIIDTALSLPGGANELHVRLYGGWTTDSVLTIRASQIQNALNKTNIFPLKHPSRGIVRGRIELAFSLLATPTLHFETTFKVRSGLNRIRLSKAACFDGCVESVDVCPVRNLARFTKKSQKVCPREGCTVTNSSVFAMYEQKMVDTMMACDLLSAIKEEGVVAVALLTEDTDLLPAIVQSRASITDIDPSPHMSLILPRGSKEFKYPHADDLIAMNIHVMNQQGESVAS